MSGVLTAVRVLHAPSDDMYPVCGGCDVYGWEAECPEWPCRTAEMVYAPSEVVQVKERAAARRTQMRLAREQSASLIPQAWSGQIVEMLKRSMGSTT